MKKIFTILLLVMATTAFAQQDPLFSQYMFNKLALNPAYAGSRESLSVDVLNRYQWVGIDGAPKTLSASVHTPLRNPHIGLGLNVYHDNIGNSIYEGALATFAYRIIFPEGKLAFGLQAGIKHVDFDWSQMMVIDPEDQMFLGQQKNQAVPDANFGVYYYTNRYFVGFSSKQLLQNQMGEVVINGRTEFTKLLRHFYGIAGAAFPLSDNVVFRPSMLVKFVKDAPPQLDLNASFLLANTFWVGASYRTEKAVSLMTEFNLTHNLRLGYSYDIWFNELRSENKGSHEIRLGLDLDVFQSRMHTPRYF